MKNILALLIISTFFLPITSEAFFVITGGARQESEANERIEQQRPVILPRSNDNEVLEEIEGELIVINEDIVEVADDSEEITALLQIIEQLRAILITLQNN